LRIRAYIDQNAGQKVLSVSAHAAPTQEEIDSGILGNLTKFFPHRFEHLELNFQTTRGLSPLKVSPFFFKFKGNFRLIAHILQ
jgi:hypothetical protein